MRERGMRGLEIAVRGRWAAISIGCLGMVLTVILGSAGFSCYYYGTVCFYYDWDPESVQQGLRPSPTTIVHLAVQLLILQSGGVPGAIPPTLEFARILGPISAAITTISAVMAFFADRLADWRLKLLRQHIVVCGLGRKGAPFVNALLDQGLPVVVVEQRLTEASVAGLRARGASVIVGDATKESILLQAMCDRARLIAVMCGDDATNFEVWLGAAMLTPTAMANPPNLWVDLDDPELQALLQGQGDAPSTQSRSGHLLDLHERTAKSLLAEHFIFDPETVRRRTHPETPTVVPGHEPRLVIAGDGPLVDSLLDNVVQAWQPRAALRGERLRLVIIGRSAQRRLDVLRERRPEVDLVCDIHLAEQPFTELRPQRQQEVLTGATTIYVCYERDLQVSVATALAMWRQTMGQGARVVVTLNRRAQLTELVRRMGAATMHKDADRLTTSSLSESSLVDDLLARGATDALTGQLTELAYQAWRDRRLAEGMTAADNAYLDPTNLQAQALALWSSRQQAYHALHKLEVIGCTVRLATQGGRSRFRFRDHELSRLAILEHDRWNNERLLAGWELGSPTDRSAQIHENLVPWDRISPDIQRYDVEAIQDLPALLHQCGFEIVRKP